MPDHMLGSYDGLILLASLVCGLLGIVALYWERRYADAMFGLLMYLVPAFVLFRGSDVLEWAGLMPRANDESLASLVRLIAMAVGTAATAAVWAMWLGFGGFWLISGDIDILNARGKAAAKAAAAEVEAAAALAAYQVEMKVLSEGAAREQAERRARNVKDYADRNVQRVTISRGVRYPIPD